MSGIGWSTLSVLPDASGFHSKLSNDINPGMHGTGLSAGKLLGVGLLAGFAAISAGIGLVLKTGFDEAKDASAGTAQLAAGIKSTGNAANVTVKGMNDLASSIQKYSGQTDDSIVASEQLLLTFTGIKNGVGAGNDVFDQATVATANMAAKMGGDAASNAIKLGKALNDPVKGMTALQKVGVMFTDAQKESITAMVDAGDVMGAQKVILAELQTEFGGAAEAAGNSLPGQMAKAKRSFEDVSQAVVEGLLPVVLPGLTSIADNITTKVIPAIGTFIQGFTDGTGAGGTFRDILTQVYENGLKPVAEWLGTAWTALQNFVTEFQNGKGAGGDFRDMLVGVYDYGLKPVADFITGPLADALGSIVTWVADAGGSKLGELIQYFKDNKTSAEILATFVSTILVAAFASMAASATAAAWTAAAAWGIAIWPVALVLVAIGAVAASFVWMAGGFDNAKEDIVFGWDTIKLGAILVAQGVVTWFGWMLDGWLAVAGGILAASIWAFGWIPGVGDKLRTAQGEFNVFKDGANAALDGVKTDLQVQADTAQAQWSLDSLRINARNNPIVIPVLTSGNMTANYAALRAAGVPGYATGTNNAAGGWAWTGENGRELINMNPGAQVINHAQSEAIAGAGAGPVDLSEASIQRLAELLGRAGVTQHIYPTPGMSEQQVGDMAGRATARALIGVAR